MYKIVPARKSDAKVIHDYNFKDFASFYKVANSLTVSLGGSYSIGITTDDAEAIKEFIEIADKYDYFTISIYVSENIVEHMALYNTGLKVADRVKPFDTFVKLINNRQLLFEKGAIYTLYNSIEHSDEEMSKAVELLYHKYGSHNKITATMLAQDFILVKITYPSTVLLAYLWQDRWRESKLKKCLADVGNDVAVAVCVKKIKEYQKGKADYFRTGVGSNLIKSLDTNRVMMMYRVLVTDRGRLNDLTLLLDLYERGLTVNDIIQEESY